MWRWSGGQRLRVEGQVGGPGTEQCRCCARLWRQRPHCCWHWPRPSLPTLRRSTSVQCSITLQLWSVGTGAHTHTLVREQFTQKRHSASKQTITDLYCINHTWHFRTFTSFVRSSLLYSIRTFLHHFGVPVQNLLIFNHNLVLLKYVERKAKLHILNHWKNCLINCYLIFSDSVLLLNTWNRKYVRLEFKF